MSGEEGPVSLSVSPLSWMRGEEGPVSLSVSSLTWMRDSRNGKMMHVQN